MYQHRDRDRDKLYLLQCNPPPPPPSQSCTNFLLAWYIYIYIHVYYWRYCFILHVLKNLAYIYSCPIVRVNKACQFSTTNLQNLALNVFTYWLSVCVSLCACWRGATAQSVERTTPGQEVVGSITALRAGSLLVGFGVSIMWYGWGRRHGLPTLSL